MFVRSILSTICLLTWNCLFIRLYCSVWRYFYEIYFWILSIYYQSCLNIKVAINNFDEIFRKDLYLNIFS